MLLRDMQKYSELRYIGDSTMKERLNMLENHRRYVEQEQRKWELFAKNLNDKIDLYKEKISQQE